MTAIAIRHFVRDLIGPTAAQRLPDVIAACTPRFLQRISEKQFDFPITHFVRNSELLFIRIPRNASASVTSAIYGSVDFIPHRTALFYQRSNPELFARQTKLAIVRNPWTRAVSAYRFLRQKGTDVAGPNSDTLKSLRGIESFEDFVLHYIRPKAHALHLLDPTVHSQWSYVCDKKGSQIVDNLFKFEDLDPLKEFLQSKGVEASVHRTNKSRAVRPLSDLMSPRMVDEIGHIYQRDVELFGYAPPV